MYYFLLFFALRFLRGFCNLKVKLEPFFLIIQAAILCFLTRAIKRNKPKSLSSTFLRGTSLNWKCQQCHLRACGLCCYQSSPRTRKQAQRL